MTMLDTNLFARSQQLTRWVLFALGIILILGLQSLVTAQPATQPKVDPAAKAAADLAASGTPAKATNNAEASVPATTAESSLWDLYWAGGVFMHPILFFSFIMIAYGLERALALRKSKVVPAELVQGLGEMSAQGGFDPRKAYRLCQDYPSSLSNVVRALLLKVGRPHAEVEQAAKETKDSEATKLYHNVRPIGVAQTVGPMLGLLGTVQGIIMAFSQISTAIAADGNKFEKFAKGIYTALITTFAGLVVAIPAAILCSYFEGRIIKLFHHIDDVLVNLLPQVERYEGKLRINQDQLTNVPVTTTNGKSTAPVSTVAPPPVVPFPAK